MTKEDNKVFIKPVGHAQIPDPARGFEIMPKEGRMVEHNQFWQRRIEDGSAKIVEADEDAQAAKPAKAKTEGN